MRPGNPRWPSLADQRRDGHRQERRQPGQHSLFKELSKAFPRQARQPDHHVVAKPVQHMLGARRCGRVYRQACPLRELLRNQGGGETRRDVELISMQLRCVHRVPKVEHSGRAGLPQRRPRREPFFRPDVLASPQAVRQVRAAKAWCRQLA